MRISIVSVFCLLALAVTATAQETTYSADSLMSAFDKKAYLRGTDITVRDVVVDNRNSKVTFRSSDLSRVVCELNAASVNHTRQPAVGSTVTVSGKVRGRGLLGNVTLDNCNLVIQEEPAVVPAEPVPQEISVVLPEIVSETAPLRPSSVEGPEEVAKPDALSKAAKAIPPAVKKRDAGAAPKLAQLDISPKEDSAPRPTVPYGLYALLVLSGAVASSILSRLRGAVRSARFSRPPAHQNTQKIRQAALEELLRKSEKKR